MQYSARRTVLCSVRAEQSGATADVLAWQAPLPVVGERWKRHTRSVNVEKQRTFSTFVRREWERLVAYVRYWIADEADRDAEDIVQDVLTGMFERQEVGEPIADLSAYVYRALRNRVVDGYRRKRRSVPLDGDTEDPDAGSLMEVLSDLRYEAAAEQEKKELRERVYEAIDGLGEDQRAVVIATELEGRTFRELSEEWGVPIGTLLARKHRAARKLRAALAKTLHGEEEPHE